MGRLQTNMTNIVAFATPALQDEEFFVLMTEGGEVAFFNFTIIDSPYAHGKYLRDSGIRRKEKKKEGQKGNSSEDPEVEKHNEEVRSKLRAKGVGANFTHAAIVVEGISRFDIKEQMKSYYINEEENLAS
mmetsp:Transcript_10804/g.10930  ORF Transcript_10804/g.10930 Transcript_10804/m.10930 type:complete len:130 (+) Transcript_10804:277-666(+)